MEYIAITVIFIIVLIILKFAFNIKIKDIQKIKELGYSEELNKITNKLPKNEEVAKSILKILKNNHTKIKQSEDKKETTSLYVVLTDTIIIANIQNTFTRIQTLAHECIHSVQEKKILMFNFIYTNLYNLFFVILVILKLFNVIKTSMVWLVGLILAGMVYYIVRAYLENDAMIKAKYLSKKYIEESNLLTDGEINTIINGYGDVNKIGIKLYNYRLILEAFARNIIFSIICIWL